MLSPRATAFFAKMPAAIITDGFDVFVQLVIAAITTEPSCSEPGTISTGCAGCSPDIGSAAPFALFAASFSFGSASANPAFIFVSGTRSCGRAGPAILGTTSLRFSSRTCV